jgi:hypothetical protein
LIMNLIDIEVCVVFALYSKIGNDQLFWQFEKGNFDSFLDTLNFLGDKQFGGSLFWHLVEITSKPKIFAN